MGRVFCVKKEGIQEHCYLHCCRLKITEGPRGTTEWNLLSGVEWWSSDIPCQNMKYGNSMLCISPNTDIPSPHFCPDFPQLSCLWALVESPQPAHLGCTPPAQLKGHVFACLSGPFPMKQPVCLTSLSRLSRRVCLLFSASHTALLLLT